MPLLDNFIILQLKNVKKVARKFLALNSILPPWNANLSVRPSGFSIKHHKNANYTVSKGKFIILKLILVKISALKEWFWTQKQINVSIIAIKILNGMRIPIAVNAEQDMLKSMENVFIIHLVIQHVRLQLLCGIKKHWNVSLALWYNPYFRMDHVLLVLKICLTM